MNKENKLIANFMGLPLVPCNIGTENGAVTQGYMHPKINVPCTTDGLQYKYSWDWLMPVVEKIEGLRDLKGNAKIEGTNIEIIGGAYKLETTYKAVIQFIKEYNN